MEITKQGFFIFVCWIAFLVAVERGARINAASATTPEHKCKCNKGEK